MNGTMTNLPQEALLFPMPKSFTHLQSAKRFSRWNVPYEKYEYMTVDLSAEPSFNIHIKLDWYIEKLNEYGKQGWRLISGTDD